MDPITYGDYPREMRSMVGDRLPKFSKEQKSLLKGSFDFLGLNYYTGYYAAHVLSRNGVVSSTSDNMARLTGKILFYLPNYFLVISNFKPISTS